MELRNAIIRLLHLLDRLDPTCESMDQDELRAMDLLRASVKGRVPGGLFYDDSTSFLLLRGDRLL